MTQIGTGRTFQVVPGDFPIRISVEAKNMAVCQVADADVKVMKDGRVVDRFFLSPNPPVATPATSRVFLFGDPEAAHDICRITILAAFATATDPNNARYEFKLEASSGDTAETVASHPANAEDTDVAFRFTH